MRLRACYKTPPNLQRMGLTGARVGHPHWLEVCSRGASIPSGVEPARRTFVQGLSYAFCFVCGPLLSGTDAELPLWGQFYQSLPSAKSKHRMKDQRHVVQSAAMARRASGSQLLPAPSQLRQVRRAAAGFNQSPEPLTWLGAAGSPKAVWIYHVAVPTRLSFVR